MNDLPWMQADFNLATLLASPEGPQYRDALERTLRDAARRTELRRQVARHHRDVGRLADLAQACAVAEEVVRGAYDAITH